jgi:restriction endonuclease S subunit
LEPVLRVIARGRKGEQGEDEFTKVYPSMIKNIEITMPVDKEGNFDVLAQPEIAKKYEFFDDIKRKTGEYQKQIRKLSIEMELEYEFEEKKLSDFFDIIKGKQIYTNDYIRKHEGNIPVYSSQTINDGIIGYIDAFDFDCNALTWTTDGIYSGAVFIRSGKFSMTTHCGALIPKNGIENILLEYVHLYLKNKLKRFVIGEQNKRVTVNVMKNLIIPLPITKDRKFDLTAQKEIAEKYNKIEQVKNNVLAELDKIKNAIIEIV